MMQTVGFSRNGNVMLIDSDMFPIKKFSVKAFLGNYPIGGVQQGPRDGRTEYLWAGLMFFNMTALPNNHTMSFLPYVQGGIALDSAGSLFQYFENNPTVKKLYAPQETRLMIDENWDPYYVYACPEKYRYLQCAGCDKHDFKNRYFPDLVVAKKPQKFVCSHSRKILQELGFIDILLDLVQQKKVPVNSEFVWGDTFFHAVASSGYSHMSKSKALLKNTLAKEFVNYMIQLGGQPA